ncbi:MAG: ABC transporter substrate-binding protein [Hydrocarboniphaga effusa]|nr:ABC transporter substrate-binding protein [Hydrocarboniphaga effusa]
MIRTLAGIICAFSVAASSAAIAQTPPDETIKKATAELQQTIQKRQVEFRKDSKLFYAEVDRIVSPSFDLKYITQLILARHYRTATEDQRRRFQTAFKKMLIASYATAMLDYADSVKTDWQPLRMAADAMDVTVQSKVLRQDGPPLPLGFAMRLKDGEWKVYDILVENISLISNFRSQTASEIKHSSLDALIQKLEGGKTLEAPKSGTKSNTGS